MGNEQAENTHSDTHAAQMSAHDFTPDPEREERCGFPEVIYAAGKTPTQTLRIAQRILETADCVLATRATREHTDAVRAEIPDAFFHERSGILFVDRREGDVRVPVENMLTATRTNVDDKDAATAAAAFPSDLESPDIDPLLEGGAGEVAVVCAGTSDLPVAEEAALTARLMGSHVTLIRDVGISGVHRVLAREDDLRRARALAVVAGMEGALPSLVAGLVDVPVVAVPTSVGYGASFNGLAALLGMLNSCAGGVSVVNIDNGFGAGQIIDRINRPPARFR